VTLQINVVESCGTSRNSHPKFLKVGYNITFNKMKSVIIVIILTVFYSCQTDNGFQEIEPSNELPKESDISSIMLANEEEAGHILSLLSNNLRGEKNPTSIEIVNYESQKDVETYFVNYDQPEEEYSIIIQANSQMDSFDLIEYSLVEYSNFSLVTITNFKGATMKLKIDKLTEEIVSFESNVSSFRTSEKMGFWECVEVAVSSCVSDGECGFICGIIYRYCLGAIGTACAVHAVS